MRENTGGKFDIIKIGNKEKVLEAIINNSMISKAELGQRAGLTIPTVTRIVDEFVADGMVESVGKGNSAGGRKPELYRMNKGACYFLGTVISNRIKSIVTDIQGNVIGGRKQTLENGNDIYSILSQVRQCIDGLLAECRIPAEKVAYSGIGTPGVGFKYINRGQDELFEPWYNVGQKELEKAGGFSFPTIYENIARLGAAGELKFGIGREIDNYLYIHVDEGIGMGAVVDGRLQMGCGGVGGELGHTVVDMTGPICYCGSRGCLEMYCCRDMLVKEYRAQLLNHGRNTDRQVKVGVEELLEAVERKEKTAMGVLENSGRILGIGVGNVINLYNPRAVIFGGDLGVCFPAYIDSAKREAKRHIFMDEAGKVKFYTTRVTNQAENMGAIALAIGKFTKEYCGK